MDIKLYNIVAIVNEGFAEMVIDTAKENGARGGIFLFLNLLTISSKHISV